MRKINPSLLGVSFTHKTKPQKIMLKFLLAIILILGFNEQPRVTSQGIYPNRYWLSIENRIGPDTLNVHCREDGPEIIDLGLQELQQYHTFNWTFISVVWSSIHYGCHLSWPSRGHLDFQAFIDTPQFVDGLCGGIECSWRASEDGVYLYNNKKKKFNRLYLWDKP